MSKNTVETEKTPEEIIRNEILNSIFVLQFSPKNNSQSLNAIDVTVTKIEDDSAETAKFDIHDLIQHEQNFWACVNNQKAQGKTSPEAVMICLSQL